MRSGGGSKSSASVTECAGDRRRQDRASAERPKSSHSRGLLCMRYPLEQGRGRHLCIFLLQGPLEQPEDEGLVPITCETCALERLTEPLHRVTVQPFDFVNQLPPNPVLGLPERDSPSPLKALSADSNLIFEPGGPDSADRSTSAGSGPPAAIKLERPPARGSPPRQRGVNLP